MIPEPLIQVWTKLLEQHPLVCLALLVFGYGDWVLDGISRSALKWIDLAYSVRRHYLKRERELRKLSRGT